MTWVRCLSTLLLVMGVPKGHYRTDRVTQHPSRAAGPGDQHPGFSIFCTAPMDDSDEKGHPKGRHQMTEDRTAKRTPTSLRWQCVFPQPASEMVDSAVDEMWKAAFHKRTPFGDLRNQFRRQHCRTLNPYGSETCPYAMEVCALAFMDAVRVTCDAKPTVPVGYFRKVAKTMAAIRADGAPLARNRGRINVLVEHEAAEFSESHADQRGSSETGLEEEKGRASPPTGPISIGDVLRQIGVQPRPDVERTGPGQEGEG